MKPFAFQKGYLVRPEDRQDRPAAPASGAFLTALGHGNGGYSHLAFPGFSGPAQVTGLREWGQHPVTPDVAHYAVSYQDEQGQPQTQQLWAPRKLVQGYVQSWGANPNRPRYYGASRDITQDAVWNQAGYKLGQPQFGDKPLRFTTPAPKPAAPGQLAFRGSKTWKSFAFAKAYRLQGNRNFQGLDVAIENRVGSIRRGKGWETKMTADYGYLRDTLGVDGDPLDVYVGPNADAPEVYVVHQHAIAKVAAWEGNRCPKCGKLPKDCWHDLDEDKCMLGYLTKEAAIHAYNRQYDDWRFLGPVSTLTMAQFRARIRNTKLKPRLIKSLGDAPSYADQLHAQHGTWSAEDVAGHAMSGSYGGWLSPQGFSGHLGAHYAHENIAERITGDRFPARAMGRLFSQGMIRVRTEEPQRGVPGALNVSFSQPHGAAVRQLQRLHSTLGRPEITWDHEQPNGEVATGAGMAGLLQRVQGGVQKALQPTTIPTGESDAREIADAFLKGLPVALELLERLEVFDKSLAGEHLPWDLRKGVAQLTPEHVQALQDLMSRQWGEYHPDAVGVEDYAGFLLPNGGVSGPIRSGLTVGAQHHSGVLLPLLSQVAGIYPRDLAANNPVNFTQGYGFQRLIASPGKQYVSRPRIDVNIGHQGATPEQITALQRMVRLNPEHQFNWEITDLNRKLPLDAGESWEEFRHHPVVQAVTRAKLAPPVSTEGAIHLG